MRWIFPLVLLLCSFSAPLWAQPSIQAQIDRDTLTTRDTLRLTIIIKGGSALTTPEIPQRGNFEVVGRSSGNAIEIINGEMSVTNTFEYLLRPTQAGNFSIGPITTHVDGQSYSAGPLKVAVLEPGGPGYHALPEPAMPQAPGPPPGVPSGITPGYPQGPPGVPPSFDQTPAAGQHPDTFVTAQVDKARAYVGEQILYTFRLYSAVSLQDARLKLPEFKEFISEEVIKENKFETNLEGLRYAVNEVRIALFPTKAGKLSTGTAGVEAAVPVAIRFNAQDPFNDPFFQRMPPSRSLEKKAFTTDSLEIEVVELPTAPKNYSGLVGEFTIDNRLDHERLAVGETLNFTVILQGKGNIREGLFPKIPESPFLKIYPGTPKVEEEKSMAGIGGKKTFNFALVAGRPGSLQLGPFATTYFNPKTQSFEELTVPSHSIQITGSGTQESLVSAGIGQGDRALLDPGAKATGLQGLRDTAEVLTRSLPSFPARLFWWLLLLLPPGAYLLLDLVRRGQRRREALSEDRKRSQAFRKAKQALAQVEWESGSPAYNQLSAILREYLSDAFLIKGGALTPSEVEDLLEVKKISADTIRRMVYLLEELDAWKYGGAGQGIPETLQLRSEIVDLLREIEKAL